MPNDSAQFSLGRAISEVQTCCFDRRHIDCGITLFTRATHALPDFLAGYSVNPRVRLRRFITWRRCCHPDHNLELGMVPERLAEKDTCGRTGKADRGSRRCSSTAQL